MSHQDITSKKLPDKIACRNISEVQVSGQKLSELRSLVQKTWDDPGDEHDLQDITKIALEAQSGKTDTTVFTYAVRMWAATHQESYAQFTAYQLQPRTICVDTASEVCGIANDNDGTAVSPDFYLNIRDLAARFNNHPFDPSLKYYVYDKSTPECGDYSQHFGRVQIDLLEAICG